MPNVISNPCLVRPRAPPTPALLTSTCSGSPRARKASAQACADERSARSSGRKKTALFAVAALIDATAASPLAADRAATYTRPPRAASPSAVARPIPVLAPVTRKVRPSASLILTAPHREREDFGTAAGAKVFAIMKPAYSTGISLLIRDRSMPWRLRTMRAPTKMTMAST